MAIATASAMIVVLLFPICSTQEICTMHNKVKQARHSLGLSQREFGIMLGLSPTNADRTVRRWEAGTKELSGTAAKALELLLEKAGHDDKSER